MNEGEDEQRVDGKGIRRRGRGIAAALATLVVRQAARHWMSLFIKVRPGVSERSPGRLNRILERREDITSSSSPPSLH